MRSGKKKKRNWERESVIWRGRVRECVGRNDVGGRERVECVSESDVGGRVRKCVGERQLRPHEFSKLCDHNNARYCYGPTIVVIGVNEEKPIYHQGQRIPLSPTRQTIHLVFLSVCITNITL